MGIPLILDSTFVLLIGVRGYSVANHTTGIVDLAQWLGVFVLVTLHEYGHCYAARRYGCATRSIRIYPFGGMASLERFPSDPWQNFVVAGSGPLVNVVLFAVSAAFYAPVVGFGLNWNSALIDFIEWAMMVNAIIFAFNMLPAFPMDGGRILIALLSMKISEQRATTITLWVAYCLFPAMLVFGIYQKAWVLVVIAIMLGLFGHFELSSRLRKLKKKALYGDLLEALRPFKI